MGLRNWEQRNSDMALYGTPTSKIGTATKRINGQIKLKEKDQFMRKIGNDKWTFPRESREKLKI